MIYNAIENIKSKEDFLKFMNTNVITHVQYWWGKVTIIQ